MKIFQNIQEFFHTPLESGLSYSVIRSIFGLNSLLYLLITKPLLHVFYGSQSVCPIHPGPWLYWSELGRFSFFRLFETPSQVETIWYLATANSVLLLLGYKIRLTTILQYLFISSFMISRCYHMNYGDHIFASTAFLMMFLPSKDPWSLDAIFARKKNPAINSQVRFSPWLKKTLMIFLGVLYFAACLPRFAGGPWMNGTAAWIALVDPITSYYWSNILSSANALPRWVFYAFNYISMLYETLVPFLIWSNKCRRFIVFFGLFFHAALALCLDVGLFSFHMSLLLAACFKYDDLQSTSDR